MTRTDDRADHLAEAPVIIGFASHVALYFSVVDETWIQNVSFSWTTVDLKHWQRQLHSLHGASGEQGMLSKTLDTSPHPPTPQKTEENTNKYPQKLDNWKTRNQTAKKI